MFILQYSSFSSFWCIFRVFSLFSSLSLFHMAVSGAWDLTPLSAWLLLHVPPSHKMTIFNTEPSHVVRCIFFLKMVQVNRWKCVVSRPWCKCPQIVLWIYQTMWDWHLTQGTICTMYRHSTTHCCMKEGLLRYNNIGLFGKEPWTLYIYGIWIYA